jgi:MarR family transcriptional regulator, organic hydroperoxide resistance regulator
MAGKTKHDELGEVLESINPLMAPLGQAFRAVGGVFERETGLGGPKWLALAMIAREDGLSQGEASRRCQLDPSRVTRVSQALEEDGLIRRERDAGDNRVVRMYLTEEGRGKVAELPQLRERFRERINGVLSDEEVDELRRMLRLLARSMKD